MIFLEFPRRPRGARFNLEAVTAQVEARIAAIRRGQE